MRTFIIFPPGNVRISPSSHKPVTHRKIIQLFSGFLVFGVTVCTTLGTVMTFPMLPPENCCTILLGADMIDISIHASNPLELAQHLQSISGSEPAVKKCLLLNPVNAETFNCKYTLA